MKWAGDRIAEKRLRRKCTGAGFIVASLTQSFARLPFVDMTEFPGNASERPDMALMACFANNIAMRAVANRK